MVYNWHRVEVGTFTGSSGWSGPPPEADSSACSCVTQRAASTEGGSFPELTGSCPSSRKQGVRKRALAIA